MLSKTIYRNRFNNEEIKSRIKLWKILCKEYFQQFIKPKFSVMDIGCGYCEFINNVKCSKKYAVDINLDVKNFANGNVNVIIGSAFNIPKKYYNKMDILFLSNFFEHLKNKDDVCEVLKIANKLLKSRGKVIIMQPNIDLARERYWDFIDHKIALNGKSLMEALKISGFKTEKYIKRFLPLTTKSTFPQHGFLIKIYLKTPPFLRPFAGQSLLVAVK